MLANSLLTAFIHLSLLYCVSAKGADMTIESDSGYSPMALAVALGHKKSMYCLSPDILLSYINNVLL